MKEISRGDIFYADLVPTVGSVQFGRRPVVVISNEKANKHSDTITVLPISSSRTKSKLPTHVKVKSVGRIPSIALAECITTIDKKQLLDKVGRCSIEEIQNINEAIKIHVSLCVV